MFKLLFQTLVFISFMGSAFAAEFTIRQYNNSEEHYIQMTGEIAEGDVDRLQEAYLDRRIAPDAELIMFSPGGNGHVMLQLAEYVKERNLTTRVTDEGECHSACAVVWAHGKKRIASEGSKIGFHVSSVYGPAVTEFISANGHIAFQQYVQQAFSDDIQYYFTLDVPKPGLLAYNVLKYGYKGDIFWIPNTDELKEILGATIF